MKKDHPNIMVIFILVNCTNELQLADVILQWPLKHAFKVEFNTWTSSIIKEHINNGQEPCVDFKMNNLKPRMCSWLHVTWMKVKEVKNMIVKGWDKTRITRAFGIEFQLVALEANFATLLFKSFKVNRKKIGCKPNTLNFTNHGRMFVREFCFSLVIYSSKHIKIIIVNIG